MRTNILISSLALLALSCGPVARGGGRGTTGAFTSQCRGDFGAGAAASQFEAFMTATYELHQAAAETQDTLRDACVSMAAELGVPVDASASGSDGTRAICEQVATTLRSEMQAIREGSNTTVELRTRPPRCEASFDAYAECAARCDVTVQPGQVEMACEGGEIRGTCTAQCTGRCSVDVEASCEGTCEGSCDGTCTATAADGSCAGHCNGTCHGQCVADVNAECGGECRGGCSVEWQRPHCTGRYTPPQVDANCRAACEAHADASLECQPGQAELIVEGGPDEATLERLERVRNAVRVGLGTVATIRERVARLQESARAVQRLLNNLPAAVREIGISAAACSAGALADLGDSVSQISVTLEVSVSVSASLNASGGT